MQSNDMLEKIFEKQVAFQKRLGNLPFNSSEKKQEFINIMSIALIDEVLEALRETPFKPWKKSQSFNEENFKEELIDAVHFLVNLCIASGMDAKEVYARFEGKNMVNQKRQDNNY